MWAFEAFNTNKQGLGMCAPRLTAHLGAAWHFSRRHRQRRRTNLGCCTAEMRADAHLGIDT